MELKSRPTSRASDTTSRSTRSCSSAAAVSKTCREFAITSSAARSTPSASPSGCRAARSTGPSGRRRVNPDAETPRSSETRDPAGSRLQQPARDQVHQLPDVAGEEVGRRARVLQRPEEGRRPRQRRSDQALQEGGRQRQAGARSEEPPRRWIELPGSDRSPPVAPYGAGHPLADLVRQQPRREDDDGQAGRRDHGRRQQPRQRDQEERRYAQDGGSEQSVRSLPLVIFFK